MRRDCVTKAKVSESEQEMVEELTSFILIADSPNPRMRSYGPTSLLNIRESRLIDMQIAEILKYFKNYEIILCTGFESDKITRYIKSKYKNINIRTVENQQFEETNSCETLRLALNNINNDSIFILDGNLIFDGKILLNNINKPYILFEPENKTLEIGININERGYTEYMGYGASNYWSEIIYLNDATIINSLSRHLSVNNFKRKFIFEAINSLIGSRLNLTAIKNDNAVYKILGVKYYHQIKGNKT
jgi:hypothetical protein